MKPTITSILFTAGLGLLFTGFAVVGFLRQEFMWGSRRTSRPSITITPETHPGFYWVILSIFLLLGILALWSAIYDLKKRRNLE